MNPCGGKSENRWRGKRKIYPALKMYKTKTNHRQNPPNTTGKHATWIRARVPSQGQQALLRIVQSSAVAAGEGVTSNSGGGGGGEGGPSPAGVRLMLTTREPSKVIFALREVVKPLKVLPGTRAQYTAGIATEILKYERSKAQASSVIHQGTPSASGVTPPHCGVLPSHGDVLSSRSDLETSSHRGVSPVQCVLPSSLHTYVG